MRHTRGLLAVLVAVCALGFCSEASAQATPCADLLVAGVDVSPAQPVAGSPATISITVRNGGSCASGGFVVQWRQDVFALTGPSRSVASLGAGEEATVVVSSDFTYPNPGNFLSVAQLDTGNAVAETNEVNNLEIRSITVVPATRNLVVTAFSVAPDPVVRGRIATASITVQNTGNSPTGTFRVDWSPFVFSTPLSRQINGLAAGESRTLTIDFTYPFDGTVDSVATVDAGGAVAETNEFDNSRSLRLVVEPPLPDLVVADVAIAPAAPVAGSVTTATITVRNDGNDPAGAFTVQWQPWIFAAPLTQQVNGLAVGASATVSFDFTFPFPGAFDGTVTVDSTAAVPEVDETNNTRATRVNAAQPTVDLTVTDLQVETGGEGGGNPVQGAPLTAVITVENLGNSPSGRFVTEWNPDTFDIIPQGPHTVSQETGPLGPGETREIRLLFTYPLAGNFRTIANVDAFNAVAETNETNNRRILNLTVDPAPIDLVIDTFTIDPASPIRGAQATATVVVRNAGPIATGPFNVQFKPTPDTFFPPFTGVNGLNPGETRTLTFPTTYNTAGTFQSTATVDIFNQVLEPFGETNNTATRTVTVRPQFAVLDVRLARLHVVDDGDDGICVPLVGCAFTDAEWDPIFYVVFRPGVTCTITISVPPFINESFSIPDFDCRILSDGSVDDQSDPEIVPSAADATIRTRLEEATPLIAAVAAFDDDLPLPRFDFMGFAAMVSFRPDYLTLDELTVTGGGCPEQSSGRCFDATFDIDVADAQPPAAAAAAARAASRAPRRVAAQSTSKQQRVALKRLRRIGVRVNRELATTCRTLKRRAARAGSPVKRCSGLDDATARARSHRTRQRPIRRATRPAPNRQAALQVDAKW